MSILHNDIVYKIQCYTVNLVGQNDNGKIYNVSVVLEPYLEENLLDRVTVAVDGLSEKEISFKEIYKRIMASPDFDGSTKK